MYLEECEYYDKIKAEIFKNLKDIGVKCGLKKSFLKNVIMEENKHKGGKIFGLPLHALRKVEVTLPQANEHVNIPEFIVEACEYIKDNINVEGLFRKAGSSARQKEIKFLLDKGGEFYMDNFNVIDIANMLKMFLRELPEPIIPYKYHDALRGCLLLLPEKRDKAVILTCLLLPQDHLNSLAYLMMFLNDVAEHSDMNKMTVNNLAIILAASVMPVALLKMTPQGNQLINQHCQIIQILIKNSNLIGVVPEQIFSSEMSFSSSAPNSFSNDKSAKKKKKRRSGSLTRVFNGLKKMVGRASTDMDLSNASSKEVHTPCIMSAGKKRKATETTSAPLSSKKKKDLLQSLPQGTVLSSTPYKSYSQDKNDRLPSRILVPTQKPEKNKSSPQKIKRRFFSKASTGGGSQKIVKSLSGISLIGRSARNKKEKEAVELSDNSSLVATLDSSEERQNLDDVSLEEHTNSEEYVRVPRSEYEAIKERVSKIETRLSHEFENIIGVSISGSEISLNNSPAGKTRSYAADHVECEYKKTLKHSDKLHDFSTEELAKRLSQELKIRRNSENKIIRSPSARKIGSIRRRSKENINCDANNKNIKRSTSGFNNTSFYPSKSLRRGKPNTVYTGLPHPNFFSPSNLNVHSVSLEPEIDKDNFGILTRSQARRASSFHGISPHKMTPNNLTKNNSFKEENIIWKCSKKFLNENVSSDEDEHSGNENNRRASIAKLRCQNAGMVMAKAKLFDNMGDTDLQPKEIRVTRSVLKTFKNNTKTRSSIRRKHLLQGNLRKLMTDANDVNVLPNDGVETVHKLNIIDKVNPVNKNMLHMLNNCVALQKQKSKIGKENIYANDPSLQTEIINFREYKAASPLKEVNFTPKIKGSITFNLTPQLRRTSRDVKANNRNTPLKPVHTPRKSPRLIHKK